MELRKGSIALCSRGERGLITSDQPQAVTYPDGTTGEAWTGYHIGPSKIGKPWSSRTPRVIAETNPVTYKSLMYLVNRARRLHRLPAVSP